LNTAARSRSSQRPERVATAIAVLVSVLGLAGWGKQVKVTGAWEDGAARPKAFTNVLVVGVSPNMSQRCAFEQFLAARIRSDATQATPSCLVVDRKQPLTRESIEAAVASTKADAVVSTILVSRSLSTENGGSRDTRGTANYKAVDSGWMTGYYGMYGVPVIYGEFETSESITRLQGEVHVASKVFAVGDGAKVVYTLDTTAKDLEARDEGLSIVTTPIAEHLRKAGLVR
jgi:hypothetical protein